MESEYGSCDSEPEGAYWSSSNDDENFDYDRDDWGTDDFYRHLAADNLKVFRRLQEQWPGGFFQVMGDEWEVGRKFANGGQTKIFEAKRKLPDGTKEKWVLKRFKRGTSLRVLMQLFPNGMLTNFRPNSRYSNGHSCSIYGVMMLPDGRFAILLKRYWDDLRRLIDLRMEFNNNQDLPFADICVAIKIMLDIALGMLALHEDGIVHRDLKASNVFIWPLGGDYDPIHGGKFICHVADFEASVWVVGTGFWRAPEILDELRNECLHLPPDLVTENSDVYSFAMTCYEILTGRIPFEGHAYDDYNLVIRGTRPEIPESIDLWIKELLEICWHHNPLRRPSFKDIVDILEAKAGEGRKLEILAPRSSTREELNDPRVQRNQDRSMEFPNKFPILIEMLAAALQCCEEEVGKLIRCLGQVRMFKFQCAHLVTSLSSDVVKLFHQFQQVRQMLMELVIARRQRLELNYCSTLIQDSNGVKNDKE